MKIVKVNSLELIFYLLNIVFVLLLFYPLFFVSFIWLGDKESYELYVETRFLYFIAGRMLLDVIFIALTMLPLWIINVFLKAILNIEKKWIVIRTLFINFMILIVYSLGLIIGGYGLMNKVLIS